MRNTQAYKSLPYNPALRDRAKALRKLGMLHEALLWNQLKKKQFEGLDFDRQKIIGHYIVDFFCAEKALVIEADGASHQGREDYDAMRDAFLNGLGLTVIHIKVKDILQDMDTVLAFLKNHPALKGTPPWEGNNLEIKNVTPNSPPVEGWQAQPDGVVSQDGL
jgi:very-short-patch-repair endonuclease